MAPEVKGHQQQQQFNHQHVKQQGKPSSASCQLFRLPWYDYSSCVQDYANNTGDPAYEMYRQATLGDVDFITGDYLAGMNTQALFYP
jgi:hypothetical protein